LIDAKCSFVCPRGHCHILRATLWNIYTCHITMNIHEFVSEKINILKFTKKRGNISCMVNTA
jgi:hypothetical protein